MHDDYDEEIAGEDLKGLSVYRRRQITTVFGPQFQNGISGLRRGMYTANGKLPKAMKMIAEGATNSDARRATGLSLYTLSKARFVLEKISGRKFLCKCGKPATHKEFCKFRIAKSPRYQANLERLSKKLSGLGRKALCGASKET